jgi:uncharacterized protein
VKAPVAAPTIVRVMVTGASGLLGRAVSDALLVRGIEVVGLTRDPERVRRTNPRVSWYQWQPSDEPVPLEAFEGVESVINLIGEPINQRLTRKAKQRIRESRVTATQNLVAAIAELDQARRPGTLVSQSAVGYYGDRGEAIVDESGQHGDDFLSEVCVDWEGAAREAEELGLRVAIIRSAPVLTREGGLLKQLLLPFKLGLGGPMAGGDQYMPWIHIDDEVGILLWALANPEVTGVINAASPRPATNREFSRTLGEVLKRPSFLPAPKLAVAALRGRELAEIVSGGQRVIPRRALDLGYPFRYANLKPALQSLLD